MSESSSTTSSNFPLIVDALADYAKETGIDLTQLPFSNQVQNCDSANAIFQLLQDKSNQFRAYWDKHRKLINCLNPVVQFLHGVSDTLGEALVIVSLPIQSVFSRYNFTVAPAGTVSTSKGNICRHWCSAHRMYILYFPLNPRHISLYQAVTGVTASYDALVELFECVSDFLKCLHVYTQIPFTPIMTDIVVKILLEVLAVLALATKQIKQGRFSKWVLS
jgi:fungal STAND N-terminal Goodbye domain